MAAKKSTTPAPPANPPIPVGSREAFRITMILVGCALLVGAFLTPWWTRGMSVDEEKLYSPDDGDADISFFLPPGTEGIYFDYKPFNTPSGGGIDYDASRSAAVAILGLGLTVTTLVCLAAVTVRWLAVTKRIDLSHDVAVRLGITAFIAGIFTVLWGAFFVPLAGDNPGMLYGEEPSHDAFADSEGIVEDARYANAGFFIGIVAAVGFPAYLWFDAARTRALAELGYTANWTTGTPNL